jgi:hypothetical protein
LALNKRYANRYAVFLARIDEEVGRDGQVVHEGITQEAEHCLASRKVGVVSELEAHSAIGDGVEDKYSFTIDRIGGRTEAGAKVVGAEKDDLSSLFEQVGHEYSPMRSQRE